MFKGHFSFLVWSLFVFLSIVWPNFSSFILVLVEYLQESLSPRCSTQCFSEPLMQLSNHVITRQYLFLWSMITVGRLVSYRSTLNWLHNMLGGGVQINTSCFGKLALWSVAWLNRLSLGGVLRGSWWVGGWGVGGLEGHVTTQKKLPPWSCCEGSSVNNAPAGLKD